MAASRMRPAPLALARPAAAPLALSRPPAARAPPPPSTVHQPFLPPVPPPQQQVGGEGWDPQPPAKKHEALVNGPLPPPNSLGRTPSVEDAQIQTILRMSRARVAQLEEEVFSLRAEMACKEAEEMHLRKPTLPSAEERSRIAQLETRLAFREREIREAEAIMRNKPAVSEAGVETPEVDSSRSTSQVQLLLEECFGDMLVLLRHDGDSLPLASATGDSALTTQSPLHSSSKPHATISPFALLSHLQLAANDSQHNDDLVDSVALGDSASAWGLSGALCRQVLKIMSRSRPPESLIPTLTAFISSPKVDEHVQACAARVLRALAIRFPSPMPEAVRAVETALANESTSATLRKEVLQLAICLARQCLGNDGSSRPLAHMKEILPLLRNAADEDSCRLLSLLLVKGSGAAPSGWPEDEQTHPDVPCFVVPCFDWPKPAAALVLQYGEAGAAFLLSHDLLNSVAERLYANEGGDDEILLLVNVWKVAAKKEVSLKHEQAHRLLVGLLRAKDRHVDIAPAEQILKTLMQLSS